MLLSSSSEEAHRVVWVSAHRFCDRNKYGEVHFKRAMQNRFTTLQDVTVLCGLCTTTERLSPCASSFSPWTLTEQMFPPVPTLTFFYKWWNQHNVFLNHSLWHFVWRTTSKWSENSDLLVFSETLSCMLAETRLLSVPTSTIENRGWHLLLPLTWGSSS